MTTVTIIRHGETLWNKKGQQQGQLDSPLSETGILQAQAVRDSLSNNFDILFSSDLGRAVQTAEIINQKLGLKLLLHKGLRERHLGILQTRTMKEFAERYPDEYRQLKGDNPDYQFPGGESARQRFDRNIDAFQEIVRQYFGAAILVVAHGGVLRSLFTHTLTLPINAPRTFSLINGSINVFSYTNSWNLLSWGITEHLVGLDSLDDF